MEEKKQFKHEFAKKENKVEFEITHENETYQVTVEYNDGKHINLEE